MRHARDLRDLADILTVDLPDFAKRRGPEMLEHLPNWRVCDPARPYMSGACLIFALTMRQWSRAKMSVLCIEINPNNRHFLSILPLAGQICCLDASRACLSSEYSVELRQTGERARVESAISAMPGVRRHKQYKSWPMIEKYIDHLVDSMDAEICSGADLFASLSPQPLDGIEVLD
jgi:hypothetical protein